MPAIGFPLLLFPFAIYNIIVFLMQGVAFSAPIVTLRLMSGVDWTISIGDILVASGIFLLLFEFSRSSRPGAKYVMDHLLALLVFGGSIAEFLWLAPFGTSTFFMLVLLAGVDFFAGLIWSVRYRGWVRQAAAEDAAAQKPVEPVVPIPQPQTTTAPEVTVPAPARSERRLEVVTPEIDAPSEAPPVKVEPRLPSADHIPDPEPSPQSPARTTSEWNVADIVRGTEDKTPPAKTETPAKTEAPAHTPTPTPTVVPLKD